MSVMTATPSGAVLTNTQFTRNNCTLATFDRTSLDGSTIQHCKFHQSRFRNTTLTRSRIEHSNFSKASLRQSQLIKTKFIKSPLIETELSESLLIQTRFEQSPLDYCSVYGVAAWDLDFIDSPQSNLMVTRDNAAITVDNLEIAQFIYTLLNNARIRDVLDTVTSKTVLILGRFTREHKAILDAIRERLKVLGYVPILFDFDPSESRDLTETIMLLAPPAAIVTFSAWPVA